MSKRAGDSQIVSMSSSGRGAPKSARTTQKIKKSPSELIAESQQLGLVRQTQEVKPKITSFLNLGQYSHHTESVVPVDEPLFKPSPSVIEFIDFEGLQTYDATLYLRNQDNVARRVKVLPPDSAFFEVLPGKGRKKNSAGDKVAPGMEVSYIIRFKPDARIDYSYDLMVITEREKFMVPIRATGGSAVLEFPDVIDFGATPVKYESEKTVLVRNIGDKPSKFLLKTSPPFSTSVLDGYLEVNAAMQVDVLFKPDRAEHYEKELILKYGDGVEAYVTLTGSAENVNVAFSHRHLVMDDTYIALSTQNEIKIHNHSDVPVDFSWRAFPTVEEEIAQKLKLQVQLKQEEAEEKQFMQQMNVDDEYISDEESLSETSEEEEEDVHTKLERKMEGQLQRRYRNIAKAIMEDPMFFYDEIFAIEPLSGRIWAKSSCSVAISFTPKAALNYQCVAYCSIVGSAERVPLLLKGQGIGPKAAFSYDELDVGDIFVESMHRYEVDLLNQGDIAVNFKLVPNTSPFGSKFQFIPSDGRLEVGGQCTIAVEFCPDLLGEFHETFYWDLVGSASSIPVTFKGHSVSPTFHFDVDRISFGVVSYGFLNSKTLTLTNTSEVPMRFALRIPGDGRFLQKEFDVIPPRGTLLPNCSQKVQIDFISVNVKTYDLCLVVDLDGVGQELASIPIQARCAVPTVSFSHKTHFRTRKSSSDIPSTRHLCSTTHLRCPPSFRSCHRMIRHECWLNSNLINRRVPFHQHPRTS
jgi:hydrocephalus-inducing protein